MITDPIRRLIENPAHIFIATTDSTGHPHMAIGKQVTISNDSLLIFENLFCPSTLRNISSNTNVSVVATLPDTGKGYQMFGSVIRSADAASSGSHDPDVNKPVMPQVLTRFIVRVEKILEFTSGIHSDLPVAE